MARASWALFLSVVLPASVGVAAPPRSTVRLETPPSIILLRVATDPGGQGRERRFFDELSLVLDDFALYAETPESDFSSSSMSGQVGTAEAMAEREGAVAVTWVTAQGKSRLLVNLVAVETGRALVRSLEVGARKNPEAVLALAVRELLGAAYLFEPERAKEKPALRQVLQTVKQELALTSVKVTPGVAAVGVAPVLAEKARFAAHAGALLAQGPVGSLGRSLRWGGRLSGEWLPVGGVHLALSAEASSWSNLADQRSWLNGWEVAPGVGFAFWWAWGRLQLAPTAEVQAVWEHFSVWTDVGGVQSFASWKVRGLVGGAARWDSERGWSVGAAAGAELSPSRVQAARIDAGEVLGATPWISWRAELWVGWN